MSESVTTRSESKERLLEWTKVNAIVLAVAPPIGGVLTGMIALFTSPRFSYEELYLLPVMLVAFATMSYVLGLPAAVFALILFLPLQYLVTRGTVYLAAICGVVGAELAILLLNVMRWLEGQPFSSEHSFSYAWGFAMFGIPAAISAAICWRITRRFHRLQ